MCRRGIDVSGNTDCSRTEFALVCRNDLLRLLQRNPGNQAYSLLSDYLQPWKTIASDECWYTRQWDMDSPKLEDEYSYEENGKMPSDEINDVKNAAKLWMGTKCGFHSG